MEPEFWKAFQEIARKTDKTLTSLIEQIDQERSGNLSSAIRLYVLKYLQEND